MFLSASQLEPSLLKRLEVLGDSAGRGLTHFVVSVLQAHNSAAGLEWSSNDGHEEGVQDSVKVDAASEALSPQLEAWQSFVSSGTQVTKHQYCAAAHALAQGILTSILSGGEPAIQRAPLDAAWREDSAGAASLSTDAFKLTLATLATACSSDGTPQAAGTCLAALLSKLQGQSDTWQGLLRQYSDGGAAGSSGAGGAKDDDADIDALLGDEDADAGGKQDVAPASDKTEVGAPSSKSLLGPELRHQISRSLSGASSGDLDALPGDLDALEQRQASNHAASTAKPARKPLLAGLMASEEGKGHLAEMPTDIRSWANFKDKQAAPPARQRNDVVGGSVALGGGKGALDQHLKGTRGAAGAGPATASGNPLHNAIISGSAARQAAERERERGGTVQGIVPGPPRGLSRNGALESPARERSLAASYASNSSRKLSISEPAPTGPQAEWKHLPALGQASRLHPYELRQPSRTALSRGNTGSPSASAAALIEDKLPMLPSLMGARGAPPKAMELLRRPSQIQRSDAHHADARPPQPPSTAASRPLIPGSKAQLPGLAGGGRTLPIPSKKSFRGDRDF